MEEFARYGQYMPRKKVEREEMWATNTAQELQDASMLHYHYAILSLH